MAKRKDLGPSPGQDKWDWIQNGRRIVYKTPEYRRLAVKRHYEKNKAWILTRIREYQKGQPDWYWAHYPVKVLDNPIGLVVVPTASSAWQRAERSLMLRDVLIVVAAHRTRLRLLRCSGGPRILGRPASTG